MDIIGFHRGRSCTTIGLKLGLILIFSPLSKAPHQWPCSMPRYHIRITTAVQYPSQDDHKYDTYDITHPHLTISPQISWWYMISHTLILQYHHKYHGDIWYHTRLSYNITTNIKIVINRLEQGPLTCLEDWTVVSQNLEHLIFLKTWNTWLRRFTFTQELLP